MSIKSRDITIGFLFFAGLLLLTLFVLAINIYFYNQGDTMKWGSKNGAFLISMFFSFPFVLLLSFGNCIALILTQNIFEVLATKLIVIVEIISAVIMYLLLNYYWEKYLYFLIDSAGLIVLAIGFSISFILFCITIFISRLTRRSS